MKSTAGCKKRLRQGPKAHLSKNSAGRESILSSGAVFNALVTHGAFIRYSTKRMLMAWHSLRRLCVAITPGGLDEAIFLPHWRIRQPGSYVTRLAERPVLRTQGHRQTEECSRDYKGYRRAEYRTSISLNGSLAKCKRGAEFFKARRNGWRGWCSADAFCVCVMYMPHNLKIIKYAQRSLLFTTKGKT